MLESGFTLDYLQFVVKWTFSIHLQVEAFSIVDIVEKMREDLQLMSPAD